MLARLLARATKPRGQDPQEFLQEHNRHRSAGDGGPTATRRRARISRVGTSSVRCFAESRRYGAPPEGREERAGDRSVSGEVFRITPCRGCYYFFRGSLQPGIDLPIDIPKVTAILLCCGQRKRALQDRRVAGHPRSDVLQTLDTMGPLHGYGIARRIEQISDAVLTLNEGTVYASLMRLQQQGWISASWGISDNNRKAKFYAITRSGRRQLTTETENWDRIAGVIARLRTAERP